MTLYGLVTKVSKGDKISDGIIATITLSNERVVHVNTNLHIKPGDIVNVLVTHNSIEVLPVQEYDETKVYSARYGYLTDKDNPTGDAFHVLEVVNGKRLGNIAFGHTSVSNAAAMVGYGITNYDYYDEVGKITKALNSSGIEGNKIWGTSLSKGFSLSFFINTLEKDTYLKMDGDELHKALKQGIDDFKFLINTIGTQGLLFALGSSFYKIEGSGKGTLSKLLSLKDMKFNKQNIKNDFSSILNKIKENISIKDALEFTIYLSKKPSNNSKKSNILTVTIFGIQYEISEIKVHSKAQVYHYAGDYIYEGDTYKIKATNLKLNIDNLFFSKGIFVNPKTNNFSINNNILNVNMLNVINNITSVSTIAKDEIKLQVGQRGIKIDVTGSSNI